MYVIEFGNEVLGGVVFFFFKQKTAYEMLRSLVGSEMCIRDSGGTDGADDFFRWSRGWRRVKQNGLRQIYGQLFALSLIHI